MSERFKDDITFLKFIEQFCNHTSSRDGLCVICGAVLSREALTDLERYAPGDCPRCAWSEPASLHKGERVDFYCKKVKDPCQIARGIIEGPCKWYASRKIGTIGIWPEEDLHAS